MRETNRNISSKFPPRTLTVGKKTHGEYSFSLNHCKFILNCKTFPQVSEIPALHIKRLLIPTTPRNDGASRDYSIARGALRAPSCPPTSISSFSVTANLSS